MFSFALLHNDEVNAFDLWFLWFYFCVFTVAYNEEPTSNNTSCQAIYFTVVHILELGVAFFFASILAFHMWMIIILYRNHFSLFFLLPRYNHFVDG